MYLTAAHTFNFITFSAYSLRSEQVGILLLLGAVWLRHGLERNDKRYIGLGLALLAIKPHLSILIIFGALWAMGMRYRYNGLILGLTALSVYVPFLAIITLGDSSAAYHQISGAARINSTLYDFLAFQFHAPPPVISMVKVTLALWAARQLWHSVNFNQYLNHAIIGTFLLTPYALQYDYPLLSLTAWQLLKRRRGAHVYALMAAAMGVLFVQKFSYEGYWQVIFIAMAYSLKDKWRGYNLWQS